MQEKKRVFWDMGGVLNRFVADEFLANLADLFRIDALAVAKFFLDGDPALWHRMEGEPDFDGRKIYECFIKQFGLSPPLRAFYRNFNTGIVPMEHEAELLVLMADLAQSGVCQGIISNINSIHARYVIRNYQQFFRHIKPRMRFFSYRIGVRKSRSPDAFKKVFEFSKSGPVSSFLIDDRDSNVEGFCKAGGTGIFFHSVNETRYWLEHYGVLGDHK
ncbi:MAG: hypothetical protein HYT98_02055 [Candidatus Sungbacteria bacterium]|nr:hypothetical protein [Candidatus Sungbacteria bacterium]